MSSSPRRVVVVLTAVAALGAAACLQTAFAQKAAVKGVVAVPIIVNPQPAAGGSADAASFDLPKDTQARRSIEAAHDYIEAKQWDKVVEALQRILDDPQDKFAPLPRKGPDGKEVVVPTSVRAEANRLLANLPKEGLEAYKTFKDAGSRADEYLKKAKDAPTVEERLATLGLVVRNYLHTDAGGEAADLLATHYMDRGDFRTASRFYSLLMTRAGGLDALPADVLFRAAYAFDQADDKADEDLVWQSARGRGIREIKFGDDAKSVGDLQDYLGGLAHAVDAVGRQWAYFLGDASHTGKGDGGPAFMRFNGQNSTADYGSADVDHLDFPDKVARLFKDAAERSVQVNQPVLPPQFPITVTVTGKDGKKHSLVVARTHSGIASYDMGLECKRVGYNPIRGTLYWMMTENRGAILDQWTQGYVQQGQRPGMIFENTTIGTLSTDGELAYTVEDLVVPPPANFRINMGFPGNPNPFGWPPEVIDAVNHSRLLAYDVAAGCSLVWDVPAIGDTKSELADSYFLGPPLCANGKLYVLAEKQQELRLICMENVRAAGADRRRVAPKVDFVLPLGTARDSKLQMDVLRRVNAAHLSYGEGVLVCPTNLGYVIAIDLLQNSLLWAYPYRDKADETADDANPAGMGGMMKAGRMLPPGIAWNPNGVPMPPPQQGWRASAPIIQDGKVVFTAPDSKSIHCVNLKDGTPVWSKPRQEGDLYLGGVVNGKVVVVGQKVVRAYNLGNGEKAWEPVETGLPSGFGAAADNIYYVPLKESAGGQGPEICGVDVDRGVAVVHSKTRSPVIKDRQNDTLGNLAFFDGAIVSQTNEGVYVYPQLKVKIAEMTEKLKANADDPEGLYDRGELSLEEGNLEGSVQDMRRVLQGGAPADLKERAKKKLYEALTEDFQHNFDQAEKYQDDYAALCANDLPATATAEERAEARKRRINYLYLIAKGKEGQRKLTEAFDKYLELNAEAQRKDGAHAESQPDELLSLVDERLVKAAPDVLAQGRIAAMVAGASEAERKPLEARIAAQWKEIQAKGDLAELRKFVTLFGSLFGVGQEARLQLAERLMDDDQDATALIDAERQLSLLRARTEDPELAARAVECLARLNTRKGLLEDAAYYYRLLRDRYPAVRVRDGKTGADLFNEMATDKRLWSELDAPPRFGATGKITAKEERENFTPPQAFTFAQSGEALPFFRRYDVVLQFGANHDLKLVDRTADKRDRPADDPRSASLRLTNTMFQIIAAGGNNQMMFNPGFPGGMQANTQPPPSPKFSYMNLGHLIVLPVGHMVFGIDAVQWKVLWEKNLFNPVSGPSSGVAANQAPQSVTVDPRDGSVQVVYQDGWTQRLGQTGPLEGAAVCLQMKDALTAVDPVSGRVLWTRSDVSTRSHIFGDDQYVFVVEMSQENKAAYTRVFRAYDGSSVRAPDFHDPYENRIRLVGRDILTADKDKDATTLRLYDPLTGKDLWKQAFAPKSTVLQAEDGDLAGVVEPDGQVRVVDLTTQKEVLTPLSKIDPKFLDKEATLAVLGDDMNVYVAPNLPLAAGTRVNTNLMPGTGLRGLNVNGELYAFRREADAKHAKGSIAWHLPEPNQQLVLNHYADMPVMLLTAQTMKFQAPFGGMTNQSFPLTVIEKRTGNRKLENANGPPAQFFALEENSREGKLEFTSAQDKVVISLENDKPALPPAAP